MQITHSLTDVSHVRSPQIPVIAIPRNNLCWHVFNRPIQLETVPDIMPVVSGDYVQIPLHPYLTAADQGLAMAYAWQLGFVASQFIQADIARLHLATGSPVQAIPGLKNEEVWRYYLGFAVGVQL